MKNSAEWTIYYNRRCGSCRRALNILNQHGINPWVVEYLNTPPSINELDDLFKKIGLDPQFAVRQNDPLFTELGLALKARSRRDWLHAIAKNPILLQRPIVVRGNRGLIARPPEKLEALF